MSQTSVATPAVFPQGACTTYLSRLSIQPGHRRVRELSRDVNQLHQLVMGGFTDHLTAHPKAPGQPGDRHRLAILFVAIRDEPPRGKRYAGQVNGLLVQSLARPRWDHLVDEEIAVVRGVSVEPHQYVEGTEVTVQMWANPTRSIGAPQRAGRYSLRSRVNLCDPNDLADWMCRRMAANGATIDGASLQFGEGRGVSAPSKDKTLKVVLHPFRFRAVVNDPVAFTTAVVDGVGRAKSYGAGLMRVRPVERG